MKSKIKVIVFVLFLGIISGVLLITVNWLTGPIIVRKQEIKVKSSVLDALQISYGINEAEEVFEENVKTVEVDGITYYLTKTGEVAFGFSGPGLWGPISGIIAIENDLKTIKGLKIFQQQETPGLGGRIAESDFLSQFKGKVILPAIKILPPGKAEKDNEIDAITGATETSRAFESLLNRSIQAHLKLISQRE